MKKQREKNMHEGSTINTTFKREQKVKMKAPDSCTSDTRSVNIILYQAINSMYLQSCTALTIHLLQNRVKFL